jgi:hypothetical protein
MAAYAKTLIHFRDGLIEAVEAGYSKGAVAL